MRCYSALRAWPELGALLGLSCECNVNAVGGGTLSAFTPCIIEVKQHGTKDNCKRPNHHTDSEGTALSWWAEGHPRSPKTYKGLLA